MVCEFCHGIINHHPRCPNYELKEPAHYCSICGDGIFNEEDDDGIAVVVSCTDFEKKVASPRTDHDFGFDC